MKKTERPADLTTSEVAQQLGVTPRAVLLRIAQGDFPNARKLPGRTSTYLIPQSDVDGYLEKKRHQSQD